MVRAINGIEASDCVVQGHSYSAMRRQCEKLIATQIVIAGIEGINTWGVDCFCATHESSDRDAIFLLAHLVIERPR